MYSRLLSFTRRFPKLTRPIMVTNIVHMDNTNWKDWQYDLYSRLAGKTRLYMDKIMCFSKEELEKEIQQLRDNIRQVRMFAVGASDFDYVYTVEEYLRLALQIYKTKYENNN